MDKNNENDKGTSFLTNTMLKNQNLLNKGKDIASLVNNLNTYTNSNSKVLNSLSKSLNLLNVTLSTFTKHTQVQQKKDFIRKEDPTKKSNKLLSDMNALMKESIKLQKEEQKKKGAGLLGLIGLFGKTLAIGGILGFLFTGKKEFLLDAVKGVTKYMLGLPIMIAEFFGKKVFLALGGGKFIGLFNGLFEKIGKNLLKLPGISKIVSFSKTLMKPIQSIMTGLGHAFAPIMKMFGGTAAKTAGKAAGKGLAKSVFMKIPVVGSLLGIFFAISRFKGGDVVGGLLEIASGMSSLLNLIVPGAGIVVGIAIDALLAFRDVKRALKPQTTKESTPKKTNKTDWRKIPVIGSFLDIFEGFKMMFSGAPIAGIKMSLLGLTFGIPGMDWVISKTLFPMVDCAAWLVKETPKFFGKVGSKIGSMATAGFNEIVKTPFIGGIISAVDSVINFIKDPKAAVISIANMMNDFMPGSGDLLITAGKMVFGTADWIMKKAGAVANWGKETFNKVSEAASTSSDNIRQDLRADAKAEQVVNAPVAPVSSAAEVPKEKKKGGGIFGWFKKKKTEAVNAAVSGSEAAVTSSAEFLEKQKSGGGSSSNQSSNINVTDLNSLKESIKRNEGFETNAYLDPPGVGPGYSVGYGHYLGTSGKGTTVTKEQADKLFEDDFGKAMSAARKIPNFDKAPFSAQAAIIDMMYNMGETRMKKFTGTLSAFSKGDYAGAARGVRNSGYYGQLPVRANANIQRLLQASGEDSAPVETATNKSAVKGGGGENVATTTPSQTASANLPTASIPSSSSVAGMQKIELGESTIQALAVAMGSSFKGAMPTTRSNMVSIDNGSMRG